MATKTLQKKKVATPVFKKNPALATPFTLVGTNPVTDLADIVSVIKNTSGKVLTFGWLPPHGKELAVNESVTVIGDLRAQLNTGGGRVWQRKATAFQNALDDKLIQFSVNRRHINYYAVDTGTTIAVGDLLYLATDDVRPASSLTWNVNIATTQADFANVFVGIAMAAHVANSGAVVNFPVQIAPTTLYTYTCTSETHEVGDTFGPAKDPLANALLNQQLVKAIATSAVARGQERHTAAATSIVVRFQTSYWGSNAAGAQ